MDVEEQTEKFQSYINHYDVNMSVSIYYPHSIEKQVLEITPTITYQSFNNKLATMLFTGHIQHSLILNVLSKMNISKIEKVYDNLNFMKPESNSNSNLSHMHQIPYEKRKVQYEIITKKRHVSQ